MMTPERYPIKVKGLQATVLPDGRWLLFDASAREMQTLSASAGVLWELCDGKTALQGLVEELESLYPDVDNTNLAEEVERTLAAFESDGLITYG